MTNVKQAADRVKIDNRISGDTIRRLVVAFFAFMPLVILFKILYELSGRENVQSDMAFLAWVRQIGSPVMDQVALALTALGDPLLIAFMTTGILAYQLRKHRLKDAAFTFFGVAGAAAVGETMRFMFERSRPDLWGPLATYNGYPFPSGYTFGATALAISLMILAWNTRWRWVAIIFGVIWALFIGLSRIYLGVQFPADVVTGWLVSLLWVLLIKVAIDTAPLRKGRRRGKVA